MRPRYKTWLCAMFLGLTPQFGCVTMKDWTATNSPSPPVEAKSNTTLPDPDAEKLCLTMAEKFEQTEHYEEAALQLEKARSHDPKLEVTHHLALLYEAAEKYPQALVEYRKELAAKPRDANLLNDVGVCLYKKGDWAESEKCLRQALELNPKHLYAWGNLGQTLAALGRIDESLDAFKHTASPSFAYSNVAFVQASQAKLVEARANYRKALELDANNEKAQRALAELDKMEKREAAKPAAAPAAPAQGG